MLWLLGPVRSVNPHLDWVDLADGRTDAGFTIDLLHTSGVRSYLESSKLNHLAAPRAACVRHRWDYDTREHWGVLATSAGEERARGDAEQPGPASEGIRTLQVLDAARASSQRGQSIDIG